MTNLYFFLVSDHDYCLPDTNAIFTRRDALETNIESLREKNRALHTTVWNLRKRKASLETNVIKLKEALKNVKSEFSEKAYRSICDQASGIPEKVFKLYENKVRVKETGNNNGIYYPKQPYCDEIRKFSLTLFSYSKKAYNYRIKYKMTSTYFK